MTISINILDIFGNSRPFDVANYTTISDFKKYLRYVYCTDEVILYKNQKEIKSGTLESNNICQNDTLNIILKIKTGFDIGKKYELFKDYEDYQKYIKEYDEYIISQNEKQNEKKEFNDFFDDFFDETFQDRDIKIYALNEIRKYTDDENSDKDMRILFQLCRDKIEDEAKKMEQQQRENKRIRENLDMLKEKMASKRRCLHKTPQKKDKPTFCGFKKGFLLK